jgi:hypothetical protein
MADFPSFVTLYPKLAPPMTISELQQHELWAKLTPSQQKFLLAYLDSNGNKLKASRATWNAGTDAVAKDLANKALRNPKIRKLLAAYQGVEIADCIFPMTRRELSDLIARRLRTPQGMKHADFIRMTELFMYLRGWDPALVINPPGAKDRGDSVDDIVLALEKAAREE